MSYVYVIKCKGQEFIAFNTCNISNEKLCQTSCAITAKLEKKDIPTFLIYIKVSHKLQLVHALDYICVSCPFQSLFITESFVKFETASP